MHQANDRSSKWIIEHFGGSILKLAGHAGFTSWQAVANEQVAPRRTPDGLIEVRYPDLPTPVLCLIEIETYAARDIARQVYEDIQLVYLNHAVVPEVIVMVLKPKGRARVEEHFTLQSPSGEVKIAATWPVIRLWEFEAENLFATGDVGLVPWIPFTHSTLTPEVLIRRCRDEIDAKALSSRDHLALLSLTHILASGVYDERLLIQLLGGTETMIESPILDEVRRIIEQRATAAGLATGIAAGMATGKTEALRRSILDLLEARFGGLSDGLTEQIEGLSGETKLRQILLSAGTSPDMPTFLVQFQAAIGG